MTATFTLDELTLLTDDASDRAADEAQGYHFEVAADGSDWWSTAERVITAVQSQLFDGEAISKGAYGNKPVTLRVKVIGQDSARLATGCAELRRVANRSGMRELVYTAPDGASPPTVFDVLSIEPMMQPGDMDENDNVRTYLVEMLCKPFPRSDTEVRTEGTAVSDPTFDLIDDIASATAWSAQDPDWAPPSGSALADAQSWTPLRYNIMPRPLVSETAKTNGWSAGSNTISISWSAGKMVVTGKPTSASTRVFANAPRAYLIGTGAVRVRFEMGSAFLCRFGMVYRWFNASGKQVGADLTITEIPRTNPTHTISALITPPAGATSVAIYPYTEFTNATGGVRTYTVRQVFIGSDGASFFGNTPDTATNCYDWTGTPDSSPQVELGLASKVVTAGQVAVTAYHHPAAGLSPVLTRTAAWETTAEAPFLVISGKLTGAPAAFQATGLLGGTAWLKPDLVTAASDGTFKAYFRVGPRSGSTVSLKVIGSDTADATTATLTATQVDTATSIPPIGTGRQGRFAVDVLGTMPAEASLQIANPGGVGSNVLIYTAPRNPDFVPALSPSLVAAGTSDPASISNKKFAVPSTAASAATWEIPHGGLVDSTYALMVKISGSGLSNGSAYSFSITQQTSPDGGGVGGYYGESVTTTGKVIATGTSMSKFLQLATLRLPTVGTDNDPDAVEGLKLWVSGGTWVVDEAWLFDLVNGSLSHVTLMSPTYPNVTVEAASPSRPQQRY
ncbi:MAG: hypothetical protein ACRDQD_07830, partial [Nocardioidaceae bacterium]